MTKTTDPIEAHAYCSHNYMTVRDSDECGCFYCCAMCGARDVRDYAPGGNALCPHCGIDAVLPDACVELSPELLAEMRRYWFDE